MKKKQLPFNTVLLYIFIGFILISLAFSVQSSVMRSIEKNKRINMIWLGTDWVDYSRHSDTLMFVSYEPKTRFLDIMSIPRDTRIHLPGVKLHRINEVFAYYYRTSKNDALACEKVREAVEQLLFCDTPIEIPYYVQVNYDCFKQLVDLLGGVPVKVDEPMHYDDKAGNLHIHFSSGNFVLNGQEALEYVRFRGKSGDRGRIFRQQRFLRNAFSRLGNPVMLLRIPRMLYRIAKNVHTNFSSWDIMSLGYDSRYLRRDNIRFLELPGKPDIRHSYWNVDDERLTNVMKLIHNQDELMEYELTNAIPDATNGTKITAEVFNGSSHRQMALKITQLLRKKGIDVVNWGNYEVAQQTTLVIDRTGNIRAAQLIASCLNNAEIISRIDQSRYVDVTVIIGENYQ